MLSEQKLEDLVTRIERDGYAILENALAPALVDALAEDLFQIEREEEVVPAKNEFEGSRTVRIYNLLARGKLYEQVPVHAEVLPLVERVLDMGCLVSSLSSIGIDPGETEQPIHADDQIIALAKPHVPTVCNSMWALTDFTEANGATRIIPGSHLFGASPELGKPYASVAAEMSKGGVLVWHGSLWHGGGANGSEKRRLGIAMNYCAGFIRQQENQQLGLPRDTVRGFSPRLRELVGYGVYNGLIGHIDKHSPAELLDGNAAGKMIWDA
ncbi:MAG: phytanoyl-CoA dioxygenase family protein [bacterium]